MVSRRKQEHLAALGVAMDYRHAVISNAAANLCPLAKIHSFWQLLSAPPIKRSANKIVSGMKNPEKHSEWKARKQQKYTLRLSYRASNACGSRPFKATGGRYSTVYTSYKSLPILFCGCTQYKFITVHSQPIDRPFSQMSQNVCSSEVVHLVGVGQPYGALAKVST
jgi:hypothetical protein